MAANVGSEGAPRQKSPAKPKFVPRPAGYAGAQSLDYKPAVGDVDALIDRELRGNRD